MVTVMSPRLFTRSILMTSLSVVPPTTRAVLVRSAGSVCRPAAATVIVLSVVGLSPRLEADRGEVRKPAGGAVQGQGRTVTARRGGAQCRGVEAEDVLGGAGDPGHAEVAARREVERGVGTGRGVNEQAVHVLV